MSRQHAWVDEFSGGVIVCDTQGMILEMNERSVQAYASEGGRSLIGKCVFDCHPEPARSKLQAMLDKQEPNIYTIEKNGLHKLIYQVPWMEGGVYRGFLELSLQLPAEMPHFIRGSVTEPADHETSEVE